MLQATKQAKPGEERRNGIGSEPDGGLGPVIVVTVGRVSLHFRRMLRDRGVSKLRVPPPSPFPPQTTSANSSPALLARPS